MAAPHNPLPDVNALDVEALRALALEQHAQLVSRDIEIDNLKLLVLKLKRMQFGRKSEKLERQIGQLELRLEELEGAPAAQPAPSAIAAAATAPNKPARRPLPESLPPITQTHAPKHETCPDCGGSLRRLGEDVSEMLEYVPGHFEVIRIERPKLSCAACERIVQEPAPSRPIDRGLAGPGLLAHVLVSKYADHLPLYRQSETYERAGLELDRSTLAGWVDGAGAVGRAGAPLRDEWRQTARRRYVGAGIGSGEWQNQDRPPVDLRAR